MASATPYHETFGEVPPAHVERALHLRHGHDPERIRRAVAVALLTWLPLATLVVAEDFSRGGGHAPNFVEQLTVHARFLLAGPLLVLAEAICVPQLASIAQHFLVTRLVRESDRARFDEAVESTRRLGASRVAELVVWIVAYAVALSLWRIVPPETLPRWHASLVGGRAQLSWAGYWHVLVSLPFLLVLVMGWLWRIALWARFLARVAALDLRVVPSHPDQTGGLRFVAYTARAVAPLGFALGTIGAGAAGAQVMLQGQSLEHFVRLVVVILVVMALLAVLPTLVFSGKLIGAMRRGVFEYGAVAGRVGQELDQKWVGREKMPEPPLPANDFSAAADLNQVVANVYKIWPVPLHLPSLAALLLATALPFLPVVLLKVPTDVILHAFAKMLL